MIRNSAHLARADVMLAAGLCLGALSASPAPAAPQTDDVRSHHTDIGNVRITGWRRLTIATRSSGALTFTGPNVVIRTIDPSRPTQFRILADLVVGHSVKQGKKTLAQVTMTGHVRYTITQQAKQGKRTVEGTAGSAAYDEQSGQVTLDAGVDATLNDPSTLDRPAILRAVHVVVPTALQTEQSSSYRVEGDPNTDTIDLALKPHPSEAQRKGGFAGPVRLSHFRTAVLEPGITAQAQGTGTTVDFDDHNGGASGQIKASAVTLEFGKRQVDRLSAAGDLQYHISRPGRSGRQSITGTGGFAAYDSMNSEITLSDGVAISVDDPDTLLEPASLQANHVTIRQTAPAAEKRPATYRYDISGQADRTQLKFHLRPASKPVVRPAAGAHQTEPPLTAGAVTISRFAEGVFEPGKSLDFTGDQVTIDNDDEQAHTRTRLLGSRLSAVFAEDRSLARAAATGNVRYHIQQPYAADKKTGKSKGTQTVDGNAARAVFINSAQGSRIEVEGPFTVAVKDPDESEGPTISGTAQDSLTYNLATGDLSVDSPDTGSSTTLMAHLPEKPKSKQPD